MINCKFPVLSTSCTCFQSAYLPQCLLIVKKRTFATFTLTPNTHSNKLEKKQNLHINNDWLRMLYLWTQCHNFPFQKSLTKTYQSMFSIQSHLRSWIYLDNNRKKDLLSMKHVANLEIKHLLLKKDLVFFHAFQ